MIPPSQRARRETPQERARAVTEAAEIKRFLRNMRKVDNIMCTSGQEFRHAGVPAVYVPLLLDPTRLPKFTPKLS